MNRIVDVFLTNLNKPFVYDIISSRSLSYKELFIKSYSLSAFLKKKGIKKKEKIIVITDNSLFKIIFLFCSIFDNYHLILFDETENKKNIKNLIKKFKVDYIFINKKNLNIIDNKIRHIGDFFIVKNNKKFICLDNIEDEKIPDIKCFLKKFTINLYLPFLTILTSGTTGNAKGIIHNLDSLLNSAKNFNSFNKINNKCVMGHFFSMSYMAGILNTIVSPFLAGGKIVLFEKFHSLSGLTFWEKVISNNINYFWASPTMLSMVIKLNRYKGVRVYVKNNIKKIFIGTAQFPLKQKIYSKKLYLSKVFESYGTTEDLLISCENKNNQINSSGKILPNVKILISNKKKIYVKTNSNNLGIYNLEKLKIIKLLKKNWRDTGDIGELIKGKYLNIIGRDKDLIIKGGKNIYPIKIENLIYTNKEIKQVAVVGIKNSLYGEDIVVYYNTFKKIDHKKFENNLIKLCDKNLSKDYKPSKFIFKKKFELTSTGKIKKNKIKSR